MVYYHKAFFSYKPCLKSTPQSFSYAPLVIIHFQFNAWRDIQQIFSKLLIIFLFGDHFSPFISISIYQAQCYSVSQNISFTIFLSPYSISSTRSMFCIIHFLFDGALDVLKQVAILFLQSQLAQLQDLQGQTQQKFQSVSFQ